mgnify:FL=1
MTTKERLGGAFLQSGMEREMRETCRWIAPPERESTGLGIGHIDVASQRGHRTQREVIVWAYWVLRAVWESEKGERKKRGDVGNRTRECGTRGCCHEKNNTNQ